MLRRFNTTSIRNLIGIKLGGVKTHRRQVQNHRETQKTTSNGRNAGYQNKLDSGIINKQGKAWSYARISWVTCGSELRKKKKRNDLCLACCPCAFYMKEMSMSNKESSKYRNSP